MVKAKEPRALRGVHLPFFAPPMKLLTHALLLLLNHPHHMIMQKLFALQLVMPLYFEQK
jgi:hypothetical protein